jgi:hypothetical protein
MCDVAPDHWIWLIGKCIKLSNSLDFGLWETLHKNSWISNLEKRFELPPRRSC